MALVGAVPGSASPFVAAWICLDILTKEETEGRYYDAEIQKEVKKLFQYIETGETGSPLTDRIEQRVSLVRQRGDIEMGYWSAYAALSDAKDEGLEEGRLSTLYELVKEKQPD